MSARMNVAGVVARLLLPVFVLVPWPGAAQTRPAELDPPGIEALRTHVSVVPLAPTALGREWEAVGLDGWQSLDPDALAAASGCLPGGGLMVLLAPPPEGWGRHADPAARRLAIHPFGPSDLAGRFTSRLARHLTGDPHVVELRRGRPLPLLPPPGPRAAPVGPTADQHRAVDAILAMAAAPRPRPVVITADRGRGKSAAMGLAAARLLAEKPWRILVTAPRRRAASVLFRHAARAMDTDAPAGDLEAAGGGRLLFLPPDRLLREHPAADILLVDEAAGLPAPLLEGLLALYPRVAFATTVHGYEGSGRGFALRFAGHLNRRAPGWQQIHLSQPLRWAPDDPLERLIFRALALDATPASPSCLDLERVSIVRLDRDALAGDEVLLRQLFGLLVEAHYQTRPADLRNLLDGPTVEVWAARQDGRVLGACLAVREGGLARALARAVWLGRRRVHGHLLPQTLAAHAGFPEAARLRHARIMRVAVHPAARRRGLGDRLVQAVAAAAGREGVDVWGTSFGATEGVAAFWRHAGLAPARLGSRRDAATGLRSAVMVAGLSPAGAALAERAAARFAHALPTLRRHHLADVTPELLDALGPGTAPATAAPRGQDVRDLLSFAFGHRPLEDCLPALERLLAAADSTMGRSSPGLDILRRRVGAARSWTDVADAGGLAGRDAVLTACRGEVRDALGDPGLRRALRHTPAGMDRHPGLD